MNVETMTNPHVMVALSVVATILSGMMLHTSKVLIYNYLKKVEWWPLAVQPTIQMMYNFGYPRTPTEKFPEGVTEPMARDGYAYLTTLCVQHFLEAMMMIPVIYHGWEKASELSRCLFLIGTFGEVGFSLYDAIQLTIRTFGSNRSDAIPIDFWFVAVVLHHTLALVFSLPMNWKYAHLPAYHRTTFSLLMAAGISYLAGNYKFTLDVRKRSEFYKYKIIVLIQLITILYTRVYLWFPSLWSMLTHFREENDMLFYYSGCTIGVVFTIFNLLLVADSLKAAVKWLPRRLPKTDEEVDDLPWSSTSGAPVPTDVIEIVSNVRRQSLIVTNDLKQRGSALLSKQMLKEFETQIKKEK